MSRYIKKIDEHVEVAYGFDHAFGYFYDVYDNRKPEKDEIIESGSSLYGMNNLVIAEKLMGLGVDKKHTDCIFLDLPF
jgi:hypothetical protein